MTDKYPKLRQDLAAAIADAKRQGGVNERAEQIAALLAERDTLAAAPVSAEPVGHVSRDASIARMTTNLPEGSPLYAAPVAAQPDLTQQTLDDVMAGIPARDAEIEALRKEIEALQAAPVKPYSLDLDPAGIRALAADAISGALALGYQGVNPPPNNEHWLAPFWEIGRESAVKAQQPVSGADGLVRQLCDALELARDCHGVMLMSDPPQKMWKGRGVDLVISEALEAAKAQLSGNPGQLDHLPDATKMVDTKGFVAGGYVSAQLREAVGVITSPSHYLDGQEFDPSQLFGNSGELPATQTQGMTLGQRIAHVGGRENAQGYVEFGSPMAVHALIQHVLRDFHRQGPVNLDPTQQDATLHAEVLDMVRMLEANERADHCGKSELGQRLEWAITALQNRIAELTKPSSQQDGGKVDEDPLQGAADWMVKDCGVKYIAELARRLSIGYNRATRLMEAARKENSNA